MSNYGAKKLVEISKLIFYENKSHRCSFGSRFPEKTHTFLYNVQLFYLVGFQMFAQVIFIGENFVYVVHKKKTNNLRAKT